MKVNRLRPRGSIPAQAVPALLILVKLAISGGADSDHPYRNPDRVNGVWVTIHDGTDDGSNHGGL